MSSDNLLVSPAITKWFCRNVAPKIKPEIKPPTPRKLRVIFSPKKPPPPGSPRICGPATSDSSPEKTIQQVRRKLDSMSSPVRRSPRRVALRLNISSPEKENFNVASSPTTDGNICVKEDYKKVLFTSNNITPLKRAQDEASMVSCMSPTANLPNLVLNPPRTPTTSHDVTQKKSPAPNWLAQLRAERDGSSNKKRNYVDNNSEARTPERTSKKSLFDDSDEAPITPPPNCKRRKLTPKPTRITTPKVRMVLK